MKTNIKPFTIIENGNEMSITIEERDILIEMGVIYNCPECGEIFYHISDKMSFEDIDMLLSTKEIKKVGDTVMCCQTKDDFKNGNYNTEMIIVSEESEYSWRVRHKTWVNGESVPLPKNYCK